MKAPRGPRHSHVRDQEKQVQAQERKRTYEGLSLQEKLARIAGRPGDSAREKARLSRV